MNKTYITEHVRIRAVILPWGKYTFKVQRRSQFWLLDVCCRLFSDWIIPSWAEEYNTQKEVFKSLSDMQRDYLETLD